MALPDKGKKTPEAVDMTEVMAAIAVLKGKKPPSSPVIVPASMFPFSEQAKREKALAPENDVAKQSSRKFFNDSIARYREAFPAKLNNLFIMRGNERIYVAPEIAALVTKKAKAVNEIIAERQMSVTHSAGQALINTFTKQYTINCISLSGATDMLFVSGQYPSAMNQIAVFDLEMGHFISEKGLITAKDGWPQYYTKTSMKKACTAEAYAVHGTCKDLTAQRIFLKTCSPKGQPPLFFLPNTSHYASGGDTKSALFKKKTPTYIKSLFLAGNPAQLGGRRNCR